MKDYLVYFKFFKSNDIRQFPVYSCKDTQMAVDYIRHTFEKCTILKVKQIIEKNDWK